MWCVLLFLLCLTAGSRQLSITELLVPNALEVGEEAYLQCKYDLLKNESEKFLVVKWWWSPLNSANNEAHLLYQRIAGHPAKIVHKNHNISIEIESNDTIKLLNVTPKVSGKYECEVYNIEEVRQNKKLIVFTRGSGPILNVSMAKDEQRNVLVTCEAFDVAPRPAIVITLNGQNVNSSGELTELNDGLYDIYENAMLPLDDAADGEFQCEIFFEDNDIPHEPYVVQETFTVDEASTPEPEERAIEPFAGATEPHDNGSDKIGDSWILLTLLSMLILLLHN